MKTAFEEYNQIVASIPDNIRIEGNMEMAVSNRIYDLMTQRGLSKAEFARSIGKRPCEITKWLSGQHNHHEKNIKAIHKILNISPESEILFVSLRYMIKEHMRYE